MKNLQTIIIILLSGLVIWSWIKPKEVIELPPIHEIETRIEYHDTVIKQFETKVIQSAYNNSILEDKIDMLSISLDSAKQSRDTLIIIKVQDTIINTLKASNDTLKSIITLKDSIISNKDIIIQSKDTIIDVLEVDLKKTKRQRNLLGIIGVVLVGVAVVK
jgi:hypothetical protein